MMLRKNPEILTSKDMSKDKLFHTQAKKTNFLQTTWKALPAFLLPVLVLGSIYGGYMTPTEAAGVAALYALPVAIWVYKGIRLRDIKDVFNDTGTSTGSIMLMLGFIMVLSRVLVMEDVPEMIMNILFSISDNTIVILLMINVFLVIIGMIMDGASATLLCAPLLLPVVTSIGVSPYQFAAILCVNLGMGNITPPCAPFLFFSAQLCDVDASKVLKPSIILILFCYLPTLLLTTFVPSTSLWLVKLIMG
jgi:tripartite ATP-independent transporter DctM subunit